MNIRVRVILEALAVVALVNVASVIYFVDRERRAAVMRLHDTIGEDARLLQIVTAGPLYDGNVAQLGATLDSIFANPDILEIELKETRGDIAVARKRAAVAQRGEHIQREFPVAHGRDELGRVRVAYTTANIEQRLAESRNAVSLFAALLTAGFAVVIYLLATGLTRPIERLTRAARAIAEGDLERDIDVRAAGELAILGQSFVRMRDAVRQKMTDLEETNLRLAAEVRERTRAEEEVRRLFGENRAITQAIRDNLYMVDEAGGLIWWNRRVEEVMGWNAQALRGAPLADFFVEADRPRVASALHEAFLRGYGEVEARLITANGPVDYHYNGVRIADASGRVLGVAGVGSDISERRRQEDALRRSDERLRQAVRASDMGIFDHDQVADTVYWSPEQRRIYGLGPDEAVTLKVFLDHVHPEDLERIGVAVARAHDPAGEGIFDIEHRIVRADGSVRWIVTRAQTFFEGQGAARRPVRTVGAIVDVTERKAFELERAQLAAIVEGSADAIVSRDLDGTVLTWNDAAERMFGYGAAEVVGRNIDFIIPADRREEVAQKRGLLAQGAKGSSYDTVRLAKGGKRIDVSATQSPIRDANGTIIGASLMFRDIAERKQAEDALRQSERRFRALVDLSSDWYWQTDRSHRFTFREGEILHRMGIPPDADYGKTRWELGFTNMSEADWAAHRALLERREEFRDLLLERGSPDGRVHWATISGKPLYDDAGSFIGYHGTGRDVTAQLNAERALRASEARISEAYATLNDAIESAPAAIAIYDAQDRLVACNSRFKAFFAFDEAIVRRGVDFETLIRRFTESGQIARPQRLGKDWLEERRRRHRDLAGPLELELTGGRWLQITETRARSGGVVTVYNDITALKEREEQLGLLNEALEGRIAERTAELAAANKELEAFAYSVSHDLRAPLRGIDGFSHLLISQHGDRLDPEARRLLERIRGGAQRMGRLITDLLELSRVARSAVQSAEVDLSALARSVVGELKAEAGNRAVEWRIEPGMRVHGDRGLLRIALANLLGNALKYTRDASPARIELGVTRRTGGLVEFCLRDNGAGFDMAYAERLFQPFQRLHSPHEFEGSGIGLATVQRVIAKHGGTIRGEGRPGAGATFHFTLSA